MDRVSEYKLSPSEKEDRKVEHLIHKRPPRSRKYKPRRGPKHDNRSDRIVEKDPDLDNTVQSEPDMSLKASADLSFIALHIAAGLDALQSAVKAFAKDLKKSSNKLAEEFQKYADEYYVDPASEGSSPFPDDGVQDIKNKHDHFKNLQKDLTKYMAKAPPEGIVGAIASAWPNGDWTNFGARAAVIGALIKSINSIRLPESIKVPFLRKNIQGFVNDKEFIRRIIESSRKKSGKIDENLVPRFAQMAAAYRIIKENPIYVDAASLGDNVDELTSNIVAQVGELNTLDHVMREWHDVVSGLEHQPGKEAELGKSSKDYDQIIDSINGFFKSDKKLIDVDTYLDEMSKYAQESDVKIPPALSDLFSPRPLTHGDEEEKAPEGPAVSFDYEEPAEPETVESAMVLEGEDLERVVQHYVDVLREALADKDDEQVNKFLKELRHEVRANLEEDVARVASRYGLSLSEALIICRTIRRIASDGHISSALTSNEVSFVRDMTARKATYHGVTDQRGNPVSPTNTGYRHYDKRFFGKDHQESIIKAAKDYLDTDWLSSGWDGGSGDAPLRAALDLAIYTADDCLYQSKIDTETYNLLLNKLASWGYDTFSETMLPFKKGSDRRASMRVEHKAIIKIADEIRNDHPLHSMAILKNVRSLLAAGEENLTAPPFGSDGETASEPPAAGPPPVDTAAEPPTEFSFKSMGDQDFEKLRKEVEQTLDEKKFTPEDIDAFLAGFDELFEGLQEKVASSVFMPSSLAMLRRASTVSNADMASIRLMVKRASTFVKLSQNPAALFSVVASISRALHKKIVAGATPTFTAGELVRYASANPETRAFLVPLITERRDAHIAKSKKNKKKVSQKKKKSGTKKDEKSKDVPKGKAMEKLSTVLSESDLNWDAAQ